MVRLYNGFRNWKTGALDFDKTDALARISDGAQTTKSWCEVIKEDTLVKPYFDFDAYHDSDNVSPDILSSLIDDIKTAVGVEESDIAIASRNRWVDKNGTRMYKVSYRFYVQGVQTTPKDMRALMDGRSKLMSCPWDKSVYRKEGLLGCVYNCKPGETAQLQPITAHTADAFVAQMLDGTERVLTVTKRAAETPVSLYKGAASKRMRLDQMVGESDDGTICHLSSEELAEAKDAILRAWGEAHPEFGDVRIMEGDLKPAGDVFYLKWRSTYCLNKSGDHTSNHSYLTITPMGVRQSCTSPGCEDYGSEWVRLPAEIVSLMFKFPDEPALQSIINNFTKSQMAVAKLAAGLAGDKWVYSGELWWEFSGHRWVRGEVKRACPSLFMFISHNVSVLYSRASSFFQDRKGYFEDKGNEFMEKKMEEMAKVANKLALDLQNVPTVTNVMKGMECIMNRSVEDFVERLDSDPYLFCFQNGVVDLRTMVLRDGQPEDMISLMASCEYDPHADTTEVDDLIRSCMKDEDTFRYVRQMMGKFLVGNNVKEEVFFFVGNGRNGKGVLAEFLKAVMGDYHETTPGSYYLYQEKDSGAANPNIAGWKGKRMLMTAETPQEAKFQSDKLKTISGNDVLKARFLHMSHYVRFTPMFKPVLQTNHLPDFTDVDTGLLERIVVVHFPFTFVERANLDPLDPSLKLRNESLKAQRDVYKTGLAKLMVEEAHAFVTGREVPKSEYILTHTKSYKKDINTVEEYLAQMIEDGEIVKEDGAKIIVRKLLDTFMTECNIPNYSQNKFTRELKKSRFKFDVQSARVGTGYKERCILGWKLAHQDEEFARI